jgi:hypothetical protein
MTKKLMAMGILVGMAGLVACEPRDEPAFDDDFQFEDAPPATPAPAPMEPMDPMMHDTLHPDTLHPDSPRVSPGTQY